MSSWPAANLDDVEAWGFVVSELDFHRKDPRHSWIDTLNRLLRKGEFLGNAQGARIDRKDIPILKPAMLRVKKEKWSLEQLIHARSWSPHPRHNPICDQCPILVLELGGSKFVVDGGTRINRRIRDRENGPHDVILMVHT